VRTLQDAQRADPGFIASNLVEASLDLRLQGYPEAKGKLLQREALERVAALPGIRHVALARTLPLGWNWTESAVLPGYEKSQTEPWTEVLCNSVTPNYFEPIGIRLLEGRPFSDSDTSASPPVVIISQAMARKYWPNQRALGAQFRLYDHVMRVPGKLMTVVGIVKDVKYGDVQDQAAPYTYHSLFQQYAAEAVLLARTAIDPGQTLDAIRREVQSIDRGLAVFEARTVEARIARSFADRRQNAALIGAFGMLATALAAIGLYAVMSYAVTQRTREFGIRIALGATRGNVRWLVISHGLKLGAIGLTCGLALSFVLARLSAAWLYGMRAADPASFAFASAFLCAVALLAAFIPAERAVRTNPIAVLRHE
jgi:predicted permease